MLEALIFQEVPCTDVFSVREAETKNCPNHWINKKRSNKMIHRNFLRIISIFFYFVTPTGSYAAQAACGDLTNGVGPFDYRDPAVRQGPNSPLSLVESYHFTSEVETLIRGNAAETPFGDLDYTLRAFPNHHRALYSFTKYELREKKKSQQAGIPYTPPQSKARFPATAECYFDRAIRWRPDDPTVRLLYGLYLQLIGKLDQALAQYKLSEKIQPKSADLNYNMGLLYFDLKQYSLAKQYAQKAYQLGYPLPGLRKKLAGVGQWP